MATIDYKNLKKPAHIKEEIWRQHLDWMEVVGKQVEENISKSEPSAGAAPASSNSDGKGRRRG